MSILLAIYCIRHLQLYMQIIRFSQFLVPFNDFLIISTMRILFSNIYCIRHLQLILTDYIYCRVFTIEGHAVNPSRIL